MKVQMDILQLLREKLGKPYDDLHYLLLALKEVLIENNEEGVAKSIPWVNAVGHEVSFTHKHHQLYSLIFQLVNMVEINGAVQNRRKLEENNLSSITGLWAYNFKELKELGFTEKEIAHQLASIHLEPVLTAHPTEAKRATILEHHRELYLLLVMRENRMYTSYELSNIRHNIKQALYRVWKTGEIYLEKPDVPSELRSVLHYLVNVFPEVIPMVDRRLIQAWEFSGFDRSSLFDGQAWPSINFGNWVGGDRDGHPLVTSKVTEETLVTLRLHAMVVIRRKLIELLKHLSFSSEAYEVDPAFGERLTAMRNSLGTSGEEVFFRNKGEVFRQWLNLMVAKLPVDTKRGHATELLEKEGSYLISEEVLHDLELLQTELVRFGAKTIALDEVQVCLRIVKTFGFQLAKLDIRQNSKFHDQAVKELLISAGFEDVAFPEWSEEKRMIFLSNELKSVRPFTGPSSLSGNAAKSVIECFQVVAKHYNKFGYEGLGSLIVSMTRSVSDLLVVFLFQREAGLLLVEPEGTVGIMPIVPLLETIEDLEKGSKILNDFLNQPIVRRSIAWQSTKKKMLTKSQQVMVGYSDSNKDGGILASQWNLYKAQSAIQSMASHHGIQIVFFHGKGGSISRGAGPAHYFIYALPQRSLSGHLRLTEQGETIAQKYANKANAAYNLELLTASMVRQSLVDQIHPTNGHFLHATLEFLSKTSQAKYSQLIESEGFMTFYRQATPIDAIESSKIGSRPSKRTGANTLDDLRAIPWVFSWTQCRYNITSWYGVGTAIAKLKEKDTKAYEELKSAVKTDPFIRYVLTNVDTSLASTDEKVMSAYAQLVDDEKVRNYFLRLMLDELQLCRQMLHDLLQKDFSERRQNHHYSSLLRASMMEHLHTDQITLLKTWRASKRAGGNENESIEIQTKLMVSINALASAMRNTG